MSKKEKKKLINYRITIYRAQFIGYKELVTFIIKSEMSLWTLGTFANIKGVYFSPFLACLHTSTPTFNHELGLFFSFFRMLTLTLL